MLKRISNTVIVLIFSLVSIMMIINYYLNITIDKLLYPGNLDITLASLISIFLLYLLTTLSLSSAIKQEKLIVITVMLGINFGFVGYWLLQYQTNHHISIESAFYQTLQLFSFNYNFSNSNFLIVIAKYFAAFSVWGIILSLVATKLIKNLNLHISLKKHNLIITDHLDYDINFILSRNKEDNKSTILVTNSDVKTTKSFSFDELQLILNAKVLSKVEIIYLLTHKVEDSIRYSFEINQKLVNSKIHRRIPCFAIIKDNHFEDIFETCNYFPHNSKIMLRPINVIDEILTTNLDKILPENNSIKLLSNNDNSSNKNICIIGVGTLFERFINIYVRFFSYENSFTNEIFICNIGESTLKFSNDIIAISNLRFIKQINNLNVTNIDILYLVNEYEYQNFKIYKQLYNNNIDKFIESCISISQNGSNINYPGNSHHKYINLSNLDFNSNKIDKAAKLINEIYWVLRQKSDESVSPILWDDLSIKQVNSNRRCAVHLLLLRRVYTDIDWSKPNNKVVEKVSLFEHNRWYINKLLDGYQFNLNSEEPRMKNNHLKKSSQLKYDEIAFNKSFTKKVLSEFAKERWTQ